MKKILAFLFSVLFIASLQAQNHRSCGTTEYMEMRKKADPGLEKRLEDQRKYLQSLLESEDPKYKVSSVIEIPVVVHVVYKTTGQNISDAQIQSQIDVLNEDFSRLNADTSKTPAAFKSVAGNPQIKFCLAKKDPNGNATTGITRTLTNVTTFYTNNDVKYTASGGINAWNTTKYLNIWVCNLGGGLLGFAEFPDGSPSNTLGAVILYNAFGRVGNVSSPFNKGRTTTHEIGHSLGLTHIWGDDNGSCAGTDYMNDTPNQADATYGSPAYPTKDGCSPNNPGIMFMNFMDYSNDAAMNMFTKNQASQMNAVINAYYSGLKTANVCSSPLDVGISAISVPVGSICGNTITPVVTLKNFGSATLTKTTIYYKVDNGTLSSFLWTGSLAGGATVNVNLSTISVGSGSHTFSCFTSNPNGVGSDSNTTNDLKTGSFTIIGAGSAGFMEGFEGSTFPPTGWTVSNPDNDTTWVRTSKGAYAGSASAVINNYDNPVHGHKDDLTTASINLSALTSPVLTFQLAYQLYTNPADSPNYSDTLEVFISTDCGVTKKSLYKKFGAALTTASPVFIEKAFFPSGPSQWRNETIDLSPYSSSNKAMITFRNTTQYENYLYLDDIFVMSSTSSLQMEGSGSELMLYPNPARDEVYVASKNQQAQHVIVQVYNLLGELVLTSKAQLNAGNTYRLDISALPSGVFYVKLQGESGRSFIHKLVHTK